MIFLHNFEPGVAYTKLSTGRRRCRNTPRAACIETTLRKEMFRVWQTGLDDPFRPHSNLNIYRAFRESWQTKRRIMGVAWLLMLVLE